MVGCVWKWVSGSLNVLRFPNDNSNECETKLLHRRILSKRCESFRWKLQLVFVQRVKLYSRLCKWARVLEIFMLRAFQIITPTSVRNSTSIGRLFQIDWGITNFYSSSVWMYYFWSGVRIGKKKGLPLTSIIIIIWFLFPAIARQKQIVWFQ